MLIDDLVQIQRRPRGEHPPDRWIEDKRFETCQRAGDEVILALRARPRGPGRRPALAVRGAHGGFPGDTGAPGQLRAHHDYHALGLLTSNKGGRPAKYQQVNVGDGGQAVVAGRIGRGSRRRGPAIGLPGAAIVTAPPTIDYKTPTALSLERKNGYVLTFSMPGYTSQKMELQRKIRVGIVVLDVLAGLLGVIIDAVTGAWYELTPDVVSVSLTKVSAAVPGPDTFTVTVSTKPTKEGADLRIESTVPGVRPG